MPDTECFVPGCTEVVPTSQMTFHRLPSSTNLLRRMLLLLFEELDPSMFSVVTNDSVICSAHFNLLMTDADLVHVLVNSMITKKPSHEAVSVAPKCDAAGCCINLYSDVTLFPFPSDEKRFTLWRRVAGWPRAEDCRYLCARHFKCDSFHDGERRALKKGVIPLYPTRPYNVKYHNYCPLKKPAPPHPQAVNNPKDIKGKAPKLPSRKKWRCAAQNCDVSYLTHPDMKKINFPSDPVRLALWKEVVGSTPNSKYSFSLCTRHFGLSQFYDEEKRTNFVKMSNPVYPTGPLNFNTNDYCPPELDITVHMDVEVSQPPVGDSAAADDPVITLVDGSLNEYILVAENSKKRCSAAGCPVNSETHPNVKIYDFPETNMRKMLVWLKIAEFPTEKPRRLCERHFDPNRRDLLPKYPFGDLDQETLTYRPVFYPGDPKCCVPGCNPAGNNDLIFHRFPLKREVLDSWITQIGCKKLALYDTGDLFRSFRVCSRHFTPSSYRLEPNTGGAKQMLKPSAIPTLHLGFEDDGKDPEPVELVETDYGDNSPLEETPSENEFKRVSPAKRKTEVCPVSPDNKRVKVELVEHHELDLDDSNSMSDFEDYAFFNDEHSITITTQGDTEGEFEEDDTNDIEDAFDIIFVAARMCKLQQDKIKELMRIGGKRRSVLNVLGSFLCQSLTEIINIAGVTFLANCFNLILGCPLDVIGRDFPDAETLADELEAFSTILLTISIKLYSAIALVAKLPSINRVRKRLVSGNGVAGMSRKGLMNLRTKYRQMRGRVLTSLALVELPVRREVSWAPAHRRSSFSSEPAGELVGNVDLGHGPINDVTLEATSVIVFYANSSSHDFLTPVGFCYVNGLSPLVRANLIRLYLLELHSIGVRCNSVVCEDSPVTHRTYEELGVIYDKGHPVNGQFNHPGFKSELVFCFTDVDDTFRSVSNLLAEKTILISESKEVLWTDIEIVSSLPKWDLYEFPLNVTRFHYLKSLQLKLKKDLRIFKKNSSLVLKAIQKHCGSQCGNGTSEFLSKMDTIDNLFSGCNMFCKESPAVNRVNVLKFLGHIRNVLVYIIELTDTDGHSLLEAPRRNLMGMALNLISLEGYIKKLMLNDRNKPQMIKTQALTLREPRLAVEGCIKTPKEFETMFKSILKKGRNPKSESAVDVGPLHIGLNVTESYKYELLTSKCEHVEEYLTTNVIGRWLEESTCPECCFLIAMDAKASHTGYLTSSLKKLLRVAERQLRLSEDIPLDDKFHRFVVSVLRDMDFSGFLRASHLFDSVDFGRTCHFTIMVNDVLRIFLRYRIGFMSTTTKVTIKNRHICELR